MKKHDCFEQTSCLDPESLSNLRLLVCGTGRCGTTSLARALSALGLACGHQSFFRVTGICQPAGLVAESSWLAAPFLGAIDCPILHLVRNPLDVLNSMEGIRFLDGGITENNWLYEQYARRFVPEISFLADSRERHMRFILSWNKKIQPWARKRIRLEDCHPDFLRELLTSWGLPLAPIGSGKIGPSLPRENSRPRAALGWADLPPGSLRDEFAEQTREFGYSL